jgi:hypothetical protein
MTPPIGGIDICCCGRNNVTVDQRALAVMTVGGPQAHTTVLTGKATRGTVIRIIPKAEPVY